MARSLALETKRWWKLRDAQDDVAAAVFDAARKAANQNKQRRKDDALFMRMYGANDVVGAGRRDDARGELNPRKAAIENLKYNLVRSVVNTGESYIAGKRPKPRFNTDDADWGLQQQAKSMELAVKGVFQANRVYQKGKLVWKDSAISSIGGFYSYWDNDQVKIERVFPGEVLVDAREGYYGEPRTLYRVRMMDSQVLSELAGKTIAPSGTTTTGNELQQLFEWAHWDSISDQTLVVEAWRLPGYGKDGKKIPGRYVCAAEGQVITDREWMRERFPFAFLYWEERQYGFYGCGIVEELRSHQRALNYINLKLADQIHNNSVSKWMVFDGPDGKPSVNINAINNDPTVILRVKAGPTHAPQVMRMQGIPPEQLQYRREIIEDAYAQIGLSQLRATGQVPKGLDSGIAIREAEDVGAMRWQTKVQAYEQLFVDLARVVVDELQDAAQRGDLKEVRATDVKGVRSRFQMVKWAEVALDEAKYEIDLTPASSLPDSSAGRTQTVQDWFGAGFIDQQQAQQLLNLPDIEGFRSLNLSSYEIILDTVERIIEDGEYFPPEPTDDLQLAIKLVTQSVNKFRLRRLPPDKLELLYMYLDDCRGLVELAQQPQQQAAQAQTQAMAQPQAAASPQATQAPQQPQPMMS